ncbi:MAG: von Willebrand factor type A domain-containing protein, partial [candidate division Zixibacteria bacterium]|nr:von Willebrand factor type A domain-containing protein [candidate division Zixibacteria bacterium]
MQTRKLLPYLLVVILMVGAAIIINAAAVGQIKGTITDKETGEAVIGASVTLVGTTYGAMTDFEGKYIIRRLQPGTYTVRISHIEFNIVEVVEVVVKPDLAAELSIQLEKKTADIGKTITISAKRDIIEKFEVSDQVVISKETIQKQPVTTVDELLDQVAGIVTDPSGEIHIRGGRAGSVQYYTDAVPPSQSSADCYAPSVPTTRSTQPLKRRHHIPTPVPPHPRCGTGYYPPIHGGSSIINGQPYDAMFFEGYGTNPFIDTQNDHLSTFAIDVDDASYVLTRSYLDRGHLPPRDAVRVEEFVNRFDYNYHQPKHGEAFSIQMEGASSRFGQNCQLLRIGIKGRDLDAETRKPANLVFVVDVSGSMGQENRLSMVKHSLELLTNQLMWGDRVGIVTYGSTGQVVLEPTHARRRSRIQGAIQMLFPGGSTYAEKGLRLGYKMANRMFEPGKINRVILCSDGVANVGQTGPDELVKMIKRYANKGITLTTVGFGMGNYNDVLMEKLADNGNGQYAYIDNMDEARRLFVDKLSGTLQVIARDVKIQVDFNPETVRSYRLLGYENRDVAD